MNHPRQLEIPGVVSLLSLMLPSGVGKMFSTKHNCQEPALAFGTDNGCPLWAPHW